MLPHRQCIKRSEEKCDCIIDYIEEVEQDKKALEDERNYLQELYNTASNGLKECCEKQIKIEKKNKALKDELTQLKEVLKFKEDEYLGVLQVGQTLIDNERKNKALEGSNERLEIMLKGKIDWQMGREKDFKYKVKALEEEIADCKKSSNIWMIKSLKQNKHSKVLMELLERALYCLGSISNTWRAEYKDIKSDYKVLRGEKDG